jgi:hypothetical protein
MRKTLLAWLAAASLASTLHCAPAHSETAPEAWVVAGIRLGDNFEQLFEKFDKSKAMVEARGYVIADGVETSRQIWFYKEGAQDSAPDVIERYDFQIRDGQVFLAGEADGNKRLTQLRFKQTAEGAGAERLQMLTDRYGPPRKESGGTYIWGCESSSGPCLEGEPSDWALEVRLRHQDAMSAWVSEYRTQLSAAKGESSASQF